MKTITINECDWMGAKYRTREWENSVDIVKWTHDYENKKYIIEYNS